MIKLTNILTELLNTFEVQAEILSNRKSSKTYREKNKIQTNLEIPCQQCNQLFKPERSTKKYCSNKCRQRSFRAKQD